MRRAIYLFCLLFLCSTVPALAAAPPKAGGSCTKVGTTQTYKGKKFTCIKNGKKLVWNSGSIVKVPASPAPIPAFEFSNLCQSDPLVPAEWAAVQEWSLRWVGCARPYRYVSTLLSPTKPVSALTSSSEYLGIDQCKIRYQGTYPHENLGYLGENSSRYRPTKSANIYVLPIQFSNALASSNPQADYGKYIAFMTEFLVNVSDVRITPKVNFHSSYINLDKTIETYKLDDPHADMTQFKNDVIAKSDPLVNFSGVDQIIIVGPPNLDGSFSYHMNWRGQWKTNEGEIKSVYQMGSIALTPRKGEVWSPDPWITVHEAIGHQLGMMDLVGRVDPSRGSVWQYQGRDLASGFWGQMSGAYGDFLIWQKWSNAMLYDDQVACIGFDKSTTHWIRPSEVKGRYLKSVMIPLANRRVIVIESIRSTGYNYKMPKNAQGALIYIVDTNETQNDFGVYLQVPSVRKRDLGASRLDATLRQGDFIQVEGIKISVVEAGEFGDVVRVEKL